LLGERLGSTRRVPGRMGVGDWSAKVVKARVPRRWWRIYKGRVQGGVRAGGTKSQVPRRPLGGGSWTGVRTAYERYGNGGDGQKRVEDYAEHDEGSAVSGLGGFPCGGILRYQD